MSATTRPTIFHLLYHEIMRGDVLLRAPGLAYSTLASMVPIIAIVLAVLSTSAFRDSQEQVFDFLASKLVIAGGANAGADNFSWLPDDDNAATGAYKIMFRDSIKPIAEKLGAVGGIGGLVLLVTAYLLFRNVEQAFNAIWRVRGERPFFTRVAITTSLIVWAPVMLVVSVSLSHYLDRWNFLGTYVVPLLFTMLLFTGLYMMMPFVRVRFLCALAGGAVAAVFWELTKLSFMLYVTRLVNYSQVYGALGVIPMLLLWLYLNWVVILGGAALACCIQQREALEREWLERERQHNPPGAVVDTVTASAPQPTLVLAAAIAVARTFREPCPGGVRASRIAAELGVEAAAARKAADKLVGGGVLARIAPAEGALASIDDPSYLPALDTSACNLSALLLAAYTERALSAGSPANATWTRAHKLAEAFSKAGANGQFAKITLANLADDAWEWPLAKTE